MPKGNGSETDTERAWALALALATIAGTLIAACMMPFVTLATIAAATMRMRRAVTAVAVIWLANQAIGFTLLGFPTTPYAFAWGGALGAASLAALAVGRAIVGRADELAAARLCAAFAAALIAYEMLLLGFASIVGGLETFAPAIVAQIAANEAIWFALLIVLRIALTRAAPRLFGPAPALRLAW